MRRAATGRERCSAVEAERDDVQRLVASLRTADPELARAPADVLSAGYRRSVILLGNVVFRVANTRQAQVAQERGGRLLSRIARLLPVPVPEPCLVLPPGGDLPFGAIGYHALPGRALDYALADGIDLAPFAVDVGRFLQALHAIPIHRVASVGLPAPEDRRAEIETVFRVIRPVLADKLAPAERCQAEAWWHDLLGDDVFWRYDPVLLQGDLWSGNLLEEQGRLVGVVDFEFAAIGDPAHDLGTLLRLRGPFAWNVLRAYREAGGVVGTDTEERMRRHWEIRGFSLVRHAIETGLPREVEIAVGKLRQGPVLSGRGAAARAG